MGGAPVTKGTSLAFDRTLLSPGERVCVAVSGGADSVALLRALHEANRGIDPLGIPLSAVHVHHGLRGGDADGDQTFVQELCDRLGIPLHVFAVDTEARQASAGEGVEEAARELRYRSFRVLLEQGNADTVATAHTRDDQAETVMMKLLRGAWTEGLSGIAPVLDRAGMPESPPLRASELRLGSAPGASGRFVRPLLSVSRGEVEAYLQAVGQTWREDRSNTDLRLTRNRVRHELMPVLRSFNPAIDELLGNTAQIAQEEERFWKAEVARVLPGVLLPGKPVRGGGRAVSTAVGEASCALELDRLRPLAPALRRRLIRAAARSIGFRLNAEETARLLALAGYAEQAGAAGSKVKGKIGSRLELRGGLRAERSARELRLSVIV